MNVLGVNGSGRAGGNTAVLVNAICRGAAEAGCDTDLLELADLDIRGCTACKACKDSQRCALDDDMRRFYTRAADTDMLVLASPVYLGHITAQLMAFIQRMYCYLGPAIENRYPNGDARVVVGLTYGAPSADYGYVADWVASRMKRYFDLPTVATFAAGGVTHEPILTDQHPEVWRAYEFGRTLKGRP